MARIICWQLDSTLRPTMKRGIDMRRNKFALPGNGNTSKKMNEQDKYLTRN
ncbi:hypothetical protein [Microcoleus sp. D2_18a_D3]|uniref:hypothetical protein n=1 Tax=Microcoleus sp. D2_18a_D3 TaxID=3055330 RepID=UPI002FD244C7